MCTANQVGVYNIIVSHYPTVVQVSSGYYTLPTVGILTTSNKLKILLFASKRGGVWFGAMNRGR